MPNAQPIGGGVYELRVRGKQEVRVLYIFVKANNIYLLHGFIKKSQKISSRDLGIVFIRKKEVDYL